MRLGWLLGQAHQGLLVEQYISYAKERGYWWANQYPYLYDDILATALLALVKGLTTIPEPEHVKGFISKCVDNEILSLLRKVAKIPNMRIVSEDDDEDRYRPRQYPPWRKMQADEVIELLQLNDYEMQILVLRNHGYTLEEIGQHLGRVKSSISEILSNIKGRYRLLRHQHPTILRPYDSA